MIRVCPGSSCTQLGSSCTQLRGLAFAVTVSAMLAGGAAQDGPLRFGIHFPAAGAGLFDKTCVGHVFEEPLLLHGVSWVVLTQAYQRLLCNQTNWFFR